MMQTNPVPPVSGGTGVDGANTALNALVDKWLEYGLLLLAVGTAAMAAVELVKALSRVRLFYHRKRVQEWVENAEANGGREAYSQLIALVASDLRHANALFDQPAEKMMAQIQAAVGVALDFPDRYPALYDFIAKPTQAQKSEHIQAAAFTGVEKSDADVWKQFAAEIRSGDVKVVPMHDADAPPSGEEEVVALREADAKSRAKRVEGNEARARLDALVARRLDAFQSSLEYAWARMNQALSGIGSTGVLLYILWDVEMSTIAWLSWSLLGGFVSPFAKDFVSALQRLRGGGSR